MVRITKGKLLPIAEVADEHWNIINPWVEAAERYSEYSLIHRIETRRDVHLNAGRAQQATFYMTLLEDDCLLLKQLILCTPENMDALIVQMTALHANLGLNPSSQYVDNFGYELLNEVFQYENWRSSKRSERLFEMLGIEICPYCNMLPVWADQERDLLLVSYDHFYDKSTYSYLCLSFYNLIPACQPCNQNYKHARPFAVDSHLHPYLDYYNQFNKFDHDYVDDDTPYTVEIDFAEDDVRSDNYNEDFGLLTRYNTNFAKRHAKFIYNTTQDYPKSVRQNLVSDWGVADEHEVEKKICQIRDIPFQSDEILNRSCGKLLRDFAFKGKIMSTENPLIR